jgi:hypothetical protein
MSLLNNGSIEEYRRRRHDDGAWMLDETDRFYRLDATGNRVYGYQAHFTGAYVCYTCGHLCDCGEED